MEIPSNPFSLQGKTVLITGAASGIGKATALLCAQMGATTILVDLNEEELKNTKLEIENSEGCSIYPLNLIDDTAVAAFVGSIPKLDGVVSNAGIVKSLLAKFNEKEDMEKIFQINTFSHINLIQELIKQKRLNKGASIVMTSSMSGVFCGLAGGSLYGATKAALVGYAKALAIELAPRGIRVNTVHPGMIETPLTKDTALSAELLAEDAKNYPLGRYGKPEEIAAAMVYLLSDATVWMTGSKLLIDGGYSLK
ncbi:MAG: SDR family oxidoreductase [Bacteroidaceae bacterium]|nr:SDR family oxidoreductase [Bacteroidaceae bacterium]